MAQVSAEITSPQNLQVIFFVSHILTFYLWPSYTSSERRYFRTSVLLFLLLVTSKIRSLDQIIFYGRVPRTQCIDNLLFFVKIGLDFGLSYVLRHYSLKAVHYLILAMPLLFKIRYCACYENKISFTLMNRFPCPISSTIHVRLVIRMIFFLNLHKCIINIFVLIHVIGLSDNLHSIIIFNTL